jgi:hypothetical protein
MARRALMLQIRRELAKEGMVLAADLRGPGGRFLAASGTAITPQHLRALEIWGIAEIAIEDTDSEYLPELQPIPDPAVEAEICGRFVAADLSDPFIEEIIKICLARACQRSAEGQDGKG